MKTMRRSSRILAVLSFSCLFTADSSVPPALDRDGDGSPDALEHFLGTNPLDRQSVFAIREIMRVESPTRTRLRWPSESGRSYRIEGSSDLSATNWQAIETVTGTGGVMSHDVPVTGGQGPRFFRLVTEYDTALPPWVGPVEGPQTAVTSTAFTPLRLQAWHPLGVDEVVFRRGGRVLGTGTSVGENQWELQWAADEADNGNDPIVAEARRGNTLTQSQIFALEVNIALPPQPQYLAQNLDLFVRLDAQGKPRAGSVVRADAAGNLPPCEYRPTGFSVSGNLASIGVRLPDGGRITGAPGSELLEFTKSQLVSGTNSPVKIGGVHQTNSARTLALGPVTVATFATLYNLPPQDGLPVSLLGHFNAVLQTGTFTKEGLQAPRFALAEGTLPFGNVLGGFQGMTLELGDNGSLYLPIAGDFALKQSGGPDATLSIGQQQPAWVRLGVDRSLRLKGKGRLSFANGPQFDVGLSLLDPVLGFEFRAGKLHAAVTGDWLGPKLPAAETVNAGTAADAPTLASATRLLSTKARAFDRYAASFQPATADTAPRGDAGDGTTPLEVIGVSKIAGATGLNVVDAELQRVLDHAARGAAAARDAATSARQWLDLERLRLGGLTSSEMSAARDEARASLRRRLEAAGKPLSLDDLRSVMQSALERWQLAQQLNVPFDHDGLQASFQLALELALASFALSVEVTAGSFSTVSPTLLSRDRFVIYQDLFTLAGLRRDAALLGLTIPSSALLGETLAQLGLRLEQVLRQALHDAELATDEMAFRDAMAEYLYLITQSQLGTFAGAALPLLSVENLSTRFSVVALTVAGLPRPLRPVAKRFHEVDRLGKILDSVPTSVSFPASPVQRAYDGLLDALNPAFSLLSTASREELLNMLLAGNAGARIRDRMTFAAGSPAWEDASRLTAVVDALATKCQAQDDATSALTGAQSLFDAADRLTQAADQARRKQYLAEAQKLVAALRAIALARAAAVPPTTADAILAGGVAIDEIAGGLTYNADAEELSGWASGKLRLPGAGASFTLSRAAFSTGGAFNVEAYGSITLPPGAGGTARFSVTERKPLRFSWRHPDHFALAGGGKFEVNGMTFEAWAALDDPQYSFGARASGLDFDLADSLKVMIPAFPNAPSFVPAAQRDLNLYFASMARGFEQLHQGLNQPSFREAGEVPDYQLPEDFGPFAWTETVANSVLNDILIPNYNRDYNATFVSLHRSMDTLLGDLQARTAADCGSAAGLEQVSKSLRFLLQAEKALAARPNDPALEPLRLETVRLRERLAPLIVCLTTFSASDDPEIENLKLNALVEFGPNKGNVTAASNNVVDSLPSRLSALGLDPATGNPLPGPPPPISPVKARAAMLNLVLRRLIMDSIGSDKLGPANSGAAQAVGRAVDHVGYSTWDGFIDRGLKLLAENERIKLARDAYLEGRNDAYFPPGHPLVTASRELGKNLRTWADEFNQTERVQQLMGHTVEHGSVRHVDGTTSVGGGALPEIQYVQAEILDREQSDPASPKFKPVRFKIKYRLPGASAAGETISQPLLEAFYRLDMPFRAATLQGVPLDDALRNVAPNAQTQPDAHASWRQAVAASQGIPAAWIIIPDSTLAAVLSQIELEVNEFVIQPSLKVGMDLAVRLRDLIIIAENSGKGGAVNSLKLHLATFDNAFKALITARKAWWHLREYTSIFIEGADAWGSQTAGTLGAFFSTQANNSLLAGFALLGDMRLLLPASRPFDLALPGDLRIEDVFGEVRYNHATSVLAGTFGGRLSLPDVGASFTLTHLSLDNAGNISIAAGIDGPLPLLDGVKMNGSLLMAGRFGLGTIGQPPVTLQQFSTSGTGTVSLPDGESFTGTFGYDTATRVFELTTTGNHLDLRLGDHFVLLDGQAGLRFGGIGPGAFPTSGRFDFGGTFGLLRKSSPPLGQPLSPAHFHLAAVQAVARLEVTANAVTVSLPQGKLLLPEAFQSPPVPPATTPARAEIAINPAQPPSVAFTLGAPDVNGLKPLQQATFSGGVTFANLGLVIPGFDEVGARNFTGTFDFGGFSLNAHGAITAANAPKLSITNGIVFFPHPVEQTPIDIQAVNVQWKLDGFPLGTLGLASDVELFDADVFTLTVLGAPGAQTTGIEILEPIAPATLPSLRIFGQLRALVDDTLLTRETTNPVIEGIPSGQFGAIAGGQLVIHAPVGNALQVVDFTLGDVGVTGDFRIGGANGVKVSGPVAGTPASIVLSGLGNLFNLADVPGRQFIVTLNGKIVQQGLPGFGLGNAKFVFFDAQQPPRFVPDTLIYDGTSWTQVPQLTMRLEQAQLRFLNNTLPLEQMLLPQNLEITSTFRVGFPDLTNPVFGGGADNVRMTFQADGTPQLQNMDGIELTLNPGIKIPPIEDLGGTLYVNGFNDPANLLLAGRLGGSMNGYKMKFIAAMRTSGPLGLAVDFNAGSAGIPLGPTGFLFTGAGGGISFLNTSADPTDLRSYVQEVDGKFKPSTTNPPPAASMSWTGFKTWRDNMLSQVPTFPPLGSGPAISVIAPGTFPADDPIGCPVNIPPASANIFGMPHPDQTLFPRRYVLKFSSITEDTLNKPINNGGMGITQQSIADATVNGTALAVSLAHQIRQQVDALTPDVPPQLGTGAQTAFASFLNELETSFATIFSEAIGTLQTPASAAQIYAAIRDKAYAGVPVKDATMAVKGIFTHAAISAFMNIEGGGTIGTTGSAGVTGQVNFLGLPVGQAKMFLSATDVNGNPNPQLTGELSMALGPLEIGSTKAVLKAEGAVTGLAAVFGQIATTLGGAVVQDILLQMNPDFAGMTLAQAEAAVTAGVPAAEHADRHAAFHAAFMAQVLRKPPGELTDTLLTQMASLIDQVNPELVICSDASIKLAGLKLSNGLASFKFRMKKHSDENNNDVLKREAYFDIAPAGFIGYGTPIAALTSGIDRASMSYAEIMPEPAGFMKSLLDGNLSSPQAILAKARQQVAMLLEQSTITGSYQVNPLGMNLFRAQARLISPDFTAHPVMRNNNANPNDNWVRPGTGVQNKIPLREELLLQAVRQNALGDVFWKGTGNNLNALFNGEYTELQGKTLTHDYFPHGGLAMASLLEVPRIFTSLPRTQWVQLTNPNEQALVRLEALRTIMRDYFGTTVRQGSFMAYLPLPNPPALFNNGTPLGSGPYPDAYDLANSLRTFVPPPVVTHGPLWEIGEGFVYLNVEGQILDIPVGTANLAAVGANQATGAPAMFAGDVRFAAGSWAELLFGANINLTAKVAGQARAEEDQRTLAAAFAGLQSLDTLGDNPSPAAAANVINSLADAAADVVAHDLPRVELSATVNSFSPPGGWGWANEIAPVGSFSLTAYSPEFLSVLPPTPTDQQNLQKTGGIAMQGNFKLGKMVTVNGQMLITPPTVAGAQPHVVAHLTGRTLSLPSPFGTVVDATVDVDTASTTFLSIQGKLQGQVSLTAQGWPVTIPASATVTVTNNSVIFGFNGATLEADFSVNPLAPILTFVGELQFPEITPPGSAISIVAKAGTGPGLRVNVSSNGSGVMTNARVVVNGLFSKAADMPGLGVDPSLNFASTSIASALGTVTLNGFTTNGLTWKVQRINGVLAVTNVSGSVTTTALGSGFTTSISGSVGSDGSFSLGGTTSTQATLTGLPVSTLATGATLSFSGSSMQVTGTVSGGLLATSLLPGGASTMAGVQLTLSTSAVTSISGTVSVSAMRLGALELRPSAGGNFTLTLGAGGISVPAASLYFTPFSTSVALTSVGAFTLPSLGAAGTITLFDQSTAITGSIGGYFASGMTFQLQRTSSSPAYRLGNVAFSASLPSGFGAGTFSVTGGSFDGQASTASLPLVSLPTLTAGRFSITNNSGVPALTSTGLSIPAPRFSCGELGISNVTIPGGALVLPSNGTFSTSGLSLSSISPTLGSLSGFTFTNVSFDLSRDVLQGMRMMNFVASVSVPGFTTSAYQVSVDSIASSAGSVINFVGTSIAQMAVGQFVIKGPAGGSLTSTLNSSNGMRFVVGQFDVTDLFTAPVDFAQVNLIVPASASANTTFMNCNMAPSLRGYALGSGGAFGLERVGGAVRLNVSTSLQLPSGPNLTNLTGTISSAGVVSLDAFLSNADFYGFPITGTATFDLSTLPLSWSTYMLDSAPRAWWRMEESSGTGLANSSTHAPSYAGSTTNTTTRPTLQQPSGFRDGTGVSMRFDGTDDFYTVPDNAALEGGNAMSVACWFKVNQFTAGKSFHTLVAKGDDSWRVAQDGTNNYLSFDTNSASSSHALRASTVAVNDGRWHHMVATYDGSMKRMYVDGVLRAAEAWSGTIRDSTYAVGIGHNTQVSGRNWNGWLDEVAFWNEAINPSHVHTLYNRGNGLSLAFSGQANLRSSAPVFQPSFSGNITSNGEFSLITIDNSATLLGFGFTNIDLRLQRSVLPSVTTTISGSATLTVPPRFAGSLPFDVLGSPPSFAASFTRSGSNTVATLTADNVTTKLAGYQPAAPGFDLQVSGNLGTTQNLTFSNFQFGQFGTSEITNIGFGSLSGTIRADGQVEIPTFFKNLVLRNQTASNTTVAFSQAGLYISAPFALKTTLSGTTRDWGSITFTGIIQPSGSYDLAGSGSIGVGNNPRINTGSFNMRFRSPDYNTWTVAPTSGQSISFGYGATSVSLTDFGVHADGFTFVGEKSGAKDWSQRTPLPIEDYLFWVLNFNFDFAADKVNGSINGSTDWKWKGIYPGGARGPEHVIKLSGQVGTDGKLYIDTPHILNGNGWWPVDLGPFGWQGGWDNFSFDGPPSGYSHPRAPSKTPLW